MLHKIKNQTGQAYAEYAVLLALIALVVLLALRQWAFPLTTRSRQSPECFAAVRRRRATTVTKLNLTAT